MERKYEDLEDWQQQIIDRHKQNLDNELIRHSNKGKGILILFLFVAFIFIAILLSN
jgi:hypothetical protein